MDHEVPVVDRAFSVYAMLARSQAAPLCAVQTLIKNLNKVFQYFTAEKARGHWRRAASAGAAGKCSSTLDICARSILDTTLYRSTPRREDTS